MNKTKRLIKQARLETYRKNKRHPFKWLPIYDEDGILLGHILTYSDMVIRKMIKQWINSDPTTSDTKIKWPYSNMFHPRRIGNDFFRINPNLIEDDTLREV